MTVSARPNRRRTHIVRPRVVRTGQRVRVADLFLFDDKTGTAMPAHVQEHTDATVAITHHDQWHADHLTSDHVTRVRQLTGMSEAQRHSVKDRIDLELVMLRT